MHPVRALLVGAAVAGLLTACGAVNRAAPPTWEPSPTIGVGGDGPGAQASPIIPLPSDAPGNGAPGGRGGPPPSSNAGGVVDPNVVATHLSSPVGLVLLPDGSALVGERTTGRIVQVQPRPGRPVPTVRTLPGLDTSGDGGLLDLALSPTYLEDGLIYAYVTTPTDNRVVDFTMHGPVTPVFTGIPKGHTGNTGRIMFGADGDLYIGTGDTGRPRLAASLNSWAGKVLRVDPIGDPAPGNPGPQGRGARPEWTSGHRVVDGLCSVPQAGSIFEVEAGTARTSSEVNLLNRGGFYGWPTPRPGAAPPIAQLPNRDGAPGGCAVLDGRLWVTSLAGEALLSAPLRPGAFSPNGSGFSSVLVHKYGRLRTVVAAPDGALWLTTSNRDGHGTPVPDDERVIRYLPSAGSGHSHL